MKRMKHIINNTTLHLVIEEDIDFHIGVLDVQIDKILNKAEETKNKEDYKGLSNLLQTLMSVRNDLIVKRKELRIDKTKDIKYSDTIEHILYRRNCIVCDKEIEPKKDEQCCKDSFCKNKYNYLKEKGRIVYEK